MGDQDGKMEGKNENTAEKVIEWERDHTNAVKDHT